MTLDLLPLPPKTRQLGHSDIQIAPLAWGMWRFTAANLSIAEAGRLVQQVLDTGINLLDTADIYGYDGNSGFGDAESLLGEVISQHPGLRQRMVLASKGGIRPPLPYDQSSDYLRSAIDASLRRLRVDCIDLYQIHRPDLLAHPQEVARVLDDGVASGKLRTLGVSNFSTHQISALQQFLGHKLVATQPEISPLRIDCFDNGELDQAIGMGLTPLAWSPLGGGRLSEPSDEREQNIANALDVFAQEHNVERSIAAYSWLMAHPSGIVPIIGSQNPARIVAASAALGLRWTRQAWYAVFAAARGSRLP